jgi:hypothetical protein
VSNSGRLMVPFFVGLVVMMVPTDWLLYIFVQGVMAQLLTTWKNMFIYIYIIAWWFCTLRWLNPQTNTRASEVLHVRITQSPAKMGFWKQYYIVVVLGLLSIASAQGWFAGFLPSGSFIRWVEISFTIFWLWMLYGFWAAEI